MLFLREPKVILTLIVVRARARNVKNERLLQPCVLGRFCFRYLKHGSEDEFYMGSEHC